MVHANSLQLKRKAASSDPAPQSGGICFALKVCSRSTAYEGDRRSSAVFRLTSLVKGWPESFEIVSQCCDSFGRVDLDELDFSIRAALSYKATNTYRQAAEQSRSFRPVVELPGTTDFPKQAIPVLLATLKAQIPAEKWCAPQLQGQVGDAGSLKSALGREGAESLAAIVVGTRPPRSPAGRMPYP